MGRGVTDVTSATPRPAWWGSPAARTLVPVPALSEPSPALSPGPSSPPVPDTQPEDLNDPGDGGAAVTVAVTRTADPAHEPEVLAWVRAGISLAEGFDGFLGAGWVRSAVDDDQWHMLYRFADRDALAAWESSSQRAWWLAAAQGLVGATRKQRFTGIEGWFDPPAHHDVEHPGDGVRGGAAAPPRWKQATTIFLVFLPLSIVLSELGAHLLPDVALPLRVLAQTLVATPLMVWFGLPWITRRMDWWLHGRPAPWRRRAGGREGSA